jgi:hypothetical protein
VYLAVGWGGRCLLEDPRRSDREMGTQISLVHIVHYTCPLNWTAGQKDSCTSSLESLNGLPTATSERREMHIGSVPQSHLCQKPRESFSPAS